MLAKRHAPLLCSLRRLSLLTSKPNVFQISKFSTSSIVLRNPTKYKSKREKLDVNRRIQTPEELFLQASNVDVENLRKEVNERTKIRYVDPNKYWISKTFPGLNLPNFFSYYDDHSNRSYIKHQLVKKFGDLNYKFIWRDLQYTEVTVGDVVDLSGNFEKSDLAVVIELPNTPDDPRYTLVNAYGEIQFVSRSKMGLRLPKMFPKKWFENCVLEEEQFWDGLEDDNIIPVGKPKYKLEDVVDRNKIFESAVARSISSDTAAQTYILPSLLSGLISEILSEMVTKAWQFLPDINIKLEVLHNILQSNEAPIQLSLYQLYNSVELTDLQMLIKDFKSQKPEDINKGYKKLFKTIASELSIGNQYDSITLGKDIEGNVDISSKVDATRFYAFMLSLRKNNQLYAHDSFSKVSSYALVLPLDRIVKFNKMVQSFKQDEALYVQLANYISTKLDDPDCNKVKSSPDFYDEFIDLLKLYCAGSIQNSVLESFVVKIMRMLSPYKNLDITGSCVYDLLLNTHEISNTEGPAKWWDNAMIPFSGVSVKCDYEQTYYDSITNENLNNYIDMDFDIHKAERLEFDNVVYCIDSENPLEIDDGISIEKLNNDEFLVSTFVADPSSYLKPSSLISKIAFDRGLTLYLPDLAGTNAIGLLPTEFNQEIQLGNFNKQTRVLKISFKYNIKTKQVIELSNKDTVAFGVAKNFIKIDYRSVNKVLADDLSNENILNSVISNTKNISADKVKQDLKNLSVVSQCLNDTASQNGRVSLFDQINIKKEIENISENENKQIQLKFKDIYNDETITNSIREGARSEQLVSEIMVMANRLAGKFCETNKIPAIFKIQLPLDMSSEVSKFSNTITTKKDSSFKELTIYQEYLTKSTIAPFPAKHEFLNIDTYATVTSPLRRFWDFVNHWQLHSYICSGKPMFSQKQVNYLALQLKYKDELNNKISNKIVGFYTFKALKYLQEHQNKEEKLKFKVIVTKKPSESGLIEVMMLDYGVRCILEASWYALSNTKSNIEKSKGLIKNIEIGDLIDDTTIKDIDLLDGSIVMNSDSV